MITAAWTLTFWLFVVGWFCCCGTTPTPEDCLFCTDGTVPYRVQVTIPAIPDGTCDCSDLAGTYILAQDGEASCNFHGDFAIDLGGACGTVTFHIEAWFFNGLYHYQALIREVGGGADNAQWAFYEGRTEPWDCSGPRTLPFFTSASGDGRCDWTAITGTVEWESLYS
jgi:hypothetical protein